MAGKWTRRELEWLRRHQHTQSIKANINPEFDSNSTTEERINTEMAKIPTQTFMLLKDGQYIVKVVHMEEAKRSEYAGEPQLQIPTDIEIIEAVSPGCELMMDDETESAGETFTEYLSLDPKSGAVKKNSKLWQIYEAATAMKLDVDDEIDTDDIIGKSFQCKVVVNEPGTRNRTEHGTYGKAKKRKQIQAEKAQAQKDLEEVEKEMEDIPF
jgi:hypothetical protein